MVGTEATGPGGGSVEQGRAKAREGEVGGSYEDWRGSRLVEVGWKGVSFDGFWNRIELVGREEVMTKIVDIPTPLQETARQTQAVSGQND